MIGIPEVGSLEKAVISGVAHKGLAIRLSDGSVAHLAIIDSKGRVVEKGDQVAKEVWNVTLNCYKNFLIGCGYLTVATKPTTSITNL